jgi:hypothetical protein
MQRVRRLKGVSVVILSRSVEGLLLCRCAQSQKISTLRSVRELPQEVRAKNLVEVEEV